MSIQNKTFCFSFVHWLYSDYICEKYSKICEKNFSQVSPANLMIVKWKFQKILQFFYIFMLNFFLIFHWKIKEQSYSILHKYFSRNSNANINYLNMSDSILNFGRI